MSSSFLEPGDASGFLPPQNAKLFRAVGSDGDASHDLLRGIRRSHRRALPPREIILPPHIGANKADRDPLPPRDLELDGGPIARLGRAIETGPRTRSRASK
jgi:hypothetical protein